MIFADSQDLNFGVQNDMSAYRQQYHVSDDKIICGIEFVRVLCYLCLRSAQNRYIFHVLVLFGVWPCRFSV